MKICWSACVKDDGKSVALTKKSAVGGFFRALGKERGEDCQIIIEKDGFSEAEWLQMLWNSACGLYDGAFRFSKEGLRRLDGEKIYENREDLCDYGDTCYTFVLEGQESEVQALEQGAWMGQCKGFARMLGNLPNNYLHTQQMETYTKRLAETCGIQWESYGDQALKDMGCGGLLAVNQGSQREAAMVVLRYEGAPGSDWIGLVGKGLLFDSGGYHLKSIDGMNGMKYDMCGAANVLETMEYLAKTGQKRNVLAVLMLAENVISPDALKMGDVITTLAGKTVEVYNTDAEGRLVLCDGITYAQKQGVKEVIDLATLTYSAHGALGDQVVALFGNEEDGVNRWKAAAEKTGEFFWQLPMGEIYHRLLEWSVCADFANYAPGKGAGASVAACFLEKFIEEGTRWIHLDMVGPSVIRGETKEMAEGASGACMTTLVSYLV